MTDHSRANGVQHLLSVEGVKYTTARSVAERVVDWVFRDLGRPSPRCQTAETPLLQVGAGEPLQDSEVSRAVQEEMARKLGDIVFRRSSLGASLRLDRASLAPVAARAGDELGWDRARQDNEIEEVMQQRRSRLPVEEPVG